MGWNLKSIASAHRYAHVFRDTHPKLTLSLTYIERLTAFTSISIDEVRLVQLGLLIFEAKATADSTVGFICNLYVISQPVYELHGKEVVGRVSTGF